MVCPMFVATVGPPFAENMWVAFLAVSLVAMIFLYGLAWWRMLSVPADVWRDWGLQPKKGHSFSTSWRGQRR
jgi:hypothetical protein